MKSANLSALHATGSQRRMDEAIANYWNGPLTRKEFQTIAEEQAKIINGMLERFATVDFALSQLADKLGITQADFQEYVKVKVAEFQANQAKQQQSSGEAASAVPDGATDTQGEKPQNIIITDGV